MSCLVGDGMGYFFKDWRFHGIFDLFVAILDRRTKLFQYFKIVFFEQKGASTI